MPSQVSWTIHNMPDILYQWKPTAANLSTGEVGLKPYLIFDKVLRDFDVLPDRISSNVEPWLLQAWFRLDSRIRWEDITDRIEPSARPKWNTMNMDCVRQREDFFMRPWSTSKGVSTRTRDAAFERLLRKAGIDPARNTTRGLTPGLIDPNAGLNCAKVLVPERWTKPRKQRKAEADTVVVVRESKPKSILSIPPRRSEGRTRRAMNKKEHGNLQAIEKKGTQTNAELNVGDRRILGERTGSDRQTLPVNKAEGVSEPLSRKRKARTIETAKVEEDRTPKRRDTGLPKRQKLQEETPRKRKTPGSGQTEQREQERPRKFRKLESLAARQLKVEKETEDLDSGPYPEGWSAKCRKQNNLHKQTLPPASPRSRKQCTAAHSRALALPLPKEEQPTDTLGVGTTRAYIGYLQAPVMETEAKKIQVKITRREPPTRFASNISRHAPVIRSPLLRTLDFHAYADTETDHSTDPSLPSTVMTPQDLGEDMISSGYSTQSDLFGNCMGDAYEDFLHRAFYGTSA